MSKAKPTAIEVLPPPQQIIRAPANRTKLDRVVQQKVAEILTARDEFVFEPFFRSRQVAYELRRLQTVPERRKWAIFYERLGCLRCQTTERIHAGNGLCSRCYPWAFQTLKQIIRQLMNAEDDGGQEFVSRNLLPGQRPARVLPAKRRKRSAS